MRPIDADALDFAPDDKNVMNGVLFMSRQRGGGRTLALVQTALKAMIDRAPTIDAVPVVHAFWRHIGGDEWCCTDCALVISTEGSWEKPWQAFCPNCGARMDGGDPDGVAGTSGP